MSRCTSPGNEPAIKAYEDLRIHLHLSRLYIDSEQDSDESRTQHTEILAAIVAGRAKDAGECMREHLLTSRGKLLE